MFGTADISIFSLSLVTEPVVAFPCMVNGPQPFIYTHRILEKRAKILDDSWERREERQLVTGASRAQTLHGSDPQKGLGSGSSML